ncbi:MAG TPA: hypothetical protein VFC65_16375 [Prolixibacteraceae bacterium]|nr:hypothetical protein [Prolixibacteraceae bacterium]
MILDELEDLFEDLDVEYPSTAQSYRMYGIFLTDFIKNPMLIDGKRLKVNENSSKHPLFKGKPEGFVHLVTRESKYSGKRNFDNQRANRIHWVKPLLENASNFNVKYFERINDKGFNQRYYWLKKKDFLVILREIVPDVLLVTSFCVDEMEKNKYQRWFDDYNKNRNKKA